MANSNDEDAMLLCSDCFQDQGLRLDAIRLGIDQVGACVNCQSATGRKLDRKRIHQLSYSFFVRGTIHKTEYGGSPTIQFNEYQHGQSEIETSPWLSPDVKLLEQAGKIGFFPYGPQLWMIGHNEILEALKGTAREHAIEKIISAFPMRTLTRKHGMYRVRVNPDHPSDKNQYDAGPEEKLSTARFDDKGFPVLYASPDLELCIHECRSTVDDNLFVAALVPTTTLTMLDFTTLLNTEVEHESTSIDMAVHFLFMAGKHAYEICRAIAKAAHAKGYDGLIFPSYFSNVRTGAMPFETVHGVSIRRIYEDHAQSNTIPNVAIFGRPVNDGRVEVTCINKVVINQVGYKVSFGPST